VSQNALELNNIQYIGRYLVQPTPDERWATDVAESELTQSMSRKSNCLDNAVAEIFYFTQTELHNIQSFEDAGALTSKQKNAWCTTILNV
jgi:hypothetical protein